MEIDFIGIGCQKCGTTKIASLIRAHPQVCFAEPKALAYFNKNNSYYQKGNNPNYNLGLDNYFTHFKHKASEKISGEFSTDYIYERKAAELIKATFPEIKLIVCLRNPIDRVVSQYQWLTLFLQVEQRTFSTLIREEKELIEKSVYHKHLKHYFNLFEPDKIKVIILEKFATNASVELKNLYQFLEIDDSFLPEDLNKYENKKRKTRSILLSKTYGKFVELMVYSGNSWVIKKLRNTPLRKLFQKINSKSIANNFSLSNEDIHFIKSKTEADVIALEQLLSIDLSIWKNKY